MGATVKTSMTSPAGLSSHQAVRASRPRRRREGAAGSTDPRESVLAGFAKDWMGTKVIGSVNLGFTLIAFNYLLSWLLAVAYGRIAASKFDPLAAKAAMEISGRSN